MLSTKHVEDGGTPLQLFSVEDSVYGALRDDILRLVVPPGTRLQLDVLARNYGVSQTPVRLALNRLQSEGLVRTLPRRGARVAALELAELEEIQLVRIGIEGWLAREGAMRVTQDEVAAMEGCLEEIDRAYRGGNLDAYLFSQWKFRDVCYRAACRPRLLAVADDQRHRAERYLRSLCGSVDALSESREHQLWLLKSCRAREGDAAEAATRTALLWTLESLGPRLEEAQSEAI